MKRLLSLLLPLMILLSLTSCRLLDDREDKGLICGFVSSNRDMLMECIESGDYSPLQKVFIIHDINPSDSGSTVDFFCGGAGFGSETVYRGFFYSSAKSMFAVWCAPSARELDEYGSGYMWRESNGDNTYYVEEICENFYYYEAEY